MQGRRRPWTSTSPSWYSPAQPHPCTPPPLLCSFVLCRQSVREIDIALRDGIHVHHTTPAVVTAACSRRAHGTLSILAPDGAFCPIRRMARPRSDAGHAARRWIRPRSTRVSLPSAWVRLVKRCWPCQPLRPLPHPPSLSQTQPSSPASPRGQSKLRELWELKMLLPSQKTWKRESLKVLQGLLMPSRLSHFRALRCVSISPLRSTIKACLLFACASNLQSFESRQTELACGKERARY